jgi:hypothetical protein
MCDEHLGHSACSDTPLKSVGANAFSGSEEHVPYIAFLHPPDEAMHPKGPLAKVVEHPASRFEYRPQDALFDSLESGELG